MIIRFTPEADLELTEAREWYSHQRDDLDLEFMQCIDNALSRVASNPLLFPVVYRDLRRIVVVAFPLLSSTTSKLMRFKLWPFFILVAIRKCGNCGRVSY